MQLKRLTLVSALPLLCRAVVQFKRAYKRNDKPICIATITLIAHLTNQQVRGN